MKLTELERDILRFALDYTYGYLTDIKEYPEKVEEQIEALKTLTQNYYHDIYRLWRQCQSILVSLPRCYDY